MGSSSQAKVVLPLQILDEELTRSLVVELKWSRELVTTTRHVGKWAIIRDLKAIIWDSPRVLPARVYPMTGPMGEVIEFKYFSVLLERQWIILVFTRDALSLSDILFITETHVSPVRPLLDIATYHWFSACRHETKSPGGVRCSEGVACLTRDSTQGKVSLVS